MHTVPETETPFRTTTPSAPATTAKQVDPVHIHVNTSWSGPPATEAGLQTRGIVSLGKSQAPIQWKNFCEQTPIDKARHCHTIPVVLKEKDIFHLKPEHKSARHAPRKVPIHLEAAFKEKIESLMKLGILEEVKEHTDWINSCVIVEKDTVNHHSPNHTIKRKLRICLDPRDLNKALEREPYHTPSVDEITAKLQGMTVFTIVDFKKGYWMVVLHPDSRKLTCMA